MKSVSLNYLELIEILKKKTPCVMATVIRTQGSTPQKAGSTALIGSGCLLAGTVGGGISELKVLQLSQTALQTKKSGIFTFNLSGEIAADSDSICGGSMTILIDAVPELHLPVFVQLKNSIEERKSGVLMTCVDESNPNLGPMDVYGNCTPITTPYTSPEHQITTTETWQSTTTECGDVIVKNGGNLTVNGATINLEGNATFSVETGGILTFNSGTIQ